MSVLVVGSVAYDTVSTPESIRQDSLGGSATYFSISSSFFTKVSMVAVVGEDFTNEDIQILKSRHIDLTNLEIKQGDTFKWEGIYSTENLNTRSTLDTRLNVFENFSPNLKGSQRRCPYLFLANINPELQINVLSQMESRPKLVALDSMNLWIDSKNELLKDAIANVDVVFMDEGETREFAKENNLVKAAKYIQSLGPKIIVVKRGENGVLLFNNHDTFSAPAFPIDQVVDPTGAGDSFAGGFLGYLASSNDLSNEGFKRAIIVGSVMGSFCVEEFGVERTSGLSSQEIWTRIDSFIKLTQLSPEKELPNWNNLFAGEDIFVPPTNTK